MKVIVTGKPGVGKTTIIKKLVNNLEDKVIGFWTEEIRDIYTKQRVGFKIIDTNCTECIFASKSFSSNYVVSSYKVDLEKFESVAVSILQKALETPNKIIVIDEIGKMELFSKKFIDIITKIIFEPEYRVITTLPIKDVHPVVKKIRNMKNAKIFEATLENRNLLVEKILKLFLRNLLI